MGHTINCAPALLPHRLDRLTAGLRQFNSLFAPGSHFALAVASNKWCKSRALVVAGVAGAMLQPAIACTRQLQRCKIQGTGPSPIIPSRSGFPTGQLRQEGGVENGRPLGPMPWPPSV